MSIDGPDLEGPESETGASTGDDAEEGEWGGISGGGESPPSSKGKHVKVPAGHELREMKEASELYKSSAFKLQVRI